MDSELWPKNEPSPPMLTRRRLLVAGGALAGAIALGACGDDDNGGSAATDTSGSAEPPEKPSKIIMRSWGEPYSTSLEASAGKSFTAKTGIKVEYDLTDFGEMKAKIEQAFKAGERPFVDVAYTVTPDAYIASLQGYAAPLDLSILTNYSKLTAAGKPDDGTTNWVNIYTYVLPILYRTDLVTLPDVVSLDELWDPKYAGQIAVNLDPNLVVWTLSKKMGLDPATDDLAPMWDRLAELKPNIGAIFTSDTELIEQMNAGEISIALALPGDAGFVDKSATKVPTEGAAQSSDAVYVTKGLPDNVTYWAQVFVNEIIEANNQTAFNQAIATVPTNSEATVSPSMKGDPAFPFTDEELAKYAVPVVNSVYATHRDEWIEAMTVALQG